MLRGEGVGVDAGVGVGSAGFAEVRGKVAG